MSEYLLLEDQPASAMPYTPMADMAKMKRIPTFRSATRKAMSRPKRCRLSPKGITAVPTKEGTKLNAGARM